MRNTSDIIEQYLKAVLTQSEQDLIEIKRSEIAERFQCVPSQINYVIRTRFTVEKGYFVESKRGGGGYIRISKVTPSDQAELCGHLQKLIQDKVDQHTAESMIARLLEEEAITPREAKMMEAAIQREVLSLTYPQDRDYIRANVLRAMLYRLQYEM
ncbi:transcriptional regulator [Salsuginibacillus halophilus]|uniref:Transcriptional regulator CtsR n=1 Tax=Salsuginibacillus halophilus TaxID=517424 RepID=A0A2P8H4Z0_9BACI|nr:CtsR family transcriptional regulator [Salsuginibacillus halophilus]PSL41292.1 transcriptional regulator [Salsuginibacillus halophilus]